MKRIGLVFMLLIVTILMANSQPIGLFASNDTTVCYGSSAQITVSNTLKETTSYLLENIPYAPMPILIGTTITSLIDDRYYGPYPIGFNFCFYGNTFANFYIGANGWVSFTPIPNAPTFDPWVTCAIPATVNGSNQPIPRNVIMGPWRDWYAQNSGNVEFYVTGTAPFRKLVVAWVNVPLFSCTSITGSFQIVLHETTNVIENHLIRVPSCPGWNSGNGVQGIMNATGTQAVVVPGRNNTNWSAQYESKRYVPNGNIIPYTWVDNFGVVYPSQSPLTVNPTVTTTYTATALSCGNPVSDAVTVSLQCCSELTTSHENVECAGGNTGSATVTVQNGFPPYDFFWSNGEQNIGSNNPSHSILNLSAGVYNVTVVSTNGLCELDTFFVISENPPLTITMASSTESCPGASDGTVTATITEGFPPYIYEMTGQFPITTVAKTASFTNLISGSYTVTVTDAFGCVITGNTFVTQLELTYTISQSELLCHGDTNASASISVQGGTPPFTYSWSNGGNAAGLTNLSAGTYCVTAMDTRGCFVEDCITFTEPSPISLYASGDQTICLSQEANIVSVAVGGVQPYSYFWTPGGYITPSITVEPAQSEEYCVYAIDFHGCISNVRCASIFVNPPLEMKLTVTEDTICKGDTTQLKLSMSGGSGGPYFYELLGSGAVSPEYPVSPDRTSRFIVVGSDGCGSPQVSEELYVTVLDAPVPNISASPITGCAPLTVQFTEHNTGNLNVNYEWDFNDGSYFNGSHDYNPKYTFKNGGLYSIKVKLTNDFGCSTIVTLPEYIDVWPAPYSDFAASTQSTTILNPTIEFYNYSLGANTNYWIFGDGDSIMTANPMPHTFPALVGEYLVQLITENTFGCRDTGFMKIEVLDDNLFYAPNAFNPHSFINDNRVFKPLINGLDESNYHFFIYNRWGEIIFETTDPNRAWDGRNNNGELYPPGSYPWFIQYADKAGTPFLRKGNVSIIY